MAHSRAVNEGHTIGRRERGLRSLTTRTEIDEFRRSGVFWPGEFACPVVLADFPPLDQEAVMTSSPRFIGTATLLSRDLFLSARHIFLDDSGTPIHVSDAAHIRPALAILRVTERPDFAIRAIAWVEAHPDRQCDLVVGKLVEWEGESPWTETSPWAGWGQPDPLNDVVAVGYPYDRFASLETADLNTIDSAFNSPRYLKGYVTRGLDMDNDPWMPRASFEVSFPLAAGMSGSPIWHAAEPAQRVLLGIGSGSLSQERPSSTTTREEPDGTRVVTEVVRVEDFGIAVRLSAVIDWEVSQAGGRTLDDLIMGPATPNS
jgi:hypothetical protein